MWKKYYVFIIMALIIMPLHGCYSYKNIGNSYINSDPMYVKIKLKNNEVRYLQNIISIETSGDSIVFINSMLDREKILINDVNEISIREIDILKMFLNTALIAGGAFLMFYLIVIYPLNFTN